MHCKTLVRASLALALATVVAVACYAAVGAHAQYASTTVLCGTLQLPSPATVVATPKWYFRARVQTVSEFEYRLISNDGLPLGVKELYDLDEDAPIDDPNFDCYVDSTTDDSTCENVFIAGGLAAPTIPSREIKFGFQKCDGWNQTANARNITIELWVRPTSVFDPLLPPDCSGFELTPIVAGVPLVTCDRSGASGITWALASPLLAAVLAVVLA